MIMRNHIYIHVLLSHDHGPPPRVRVTTGLFEEKLVTADLKQATKDKRMEVSQIEPILADRIIQARPFHNWDEVRMVPQIGPQ